VRTTTSIFRIGHLLRKEAIMNALYFRFASSFLEPIWNRDCVASSPGHPRPDEKA
jgi:glucose-6-phosphate 1-dehydrogenase